MKQLILTADDFGLATCVNDAVAEAHRHGVLTSASLMVGGLAFEDAVRRARQTQTLAVGLHLVLLQGRATLSPRHIPDLVDARGCFRTSAVGTGFRYFFQPRLRAQLEAEIRAQIEKFLATGLFMDQINGHLNIHMHPTVWSIIRKLADEYRIRAVRISSQPWWQAMTHHRHQPIYKTLHAIAFRPLAMRARSSLQGTGIHCATRVHGLLESGNANENYLLALLPLLPDGLTEIYFHPAKTPCEEFRRWNPAYNAEGELEALTSPRVKDSVRQSEIELVTYSNSKGH